MADWLDTLSAFIAGFRFEALKPGTVEQTGYVLLDTMGAIAGGAAEPEMQALTRTMTAANSGAASVIGTGLKTAPQTAAFLNGAAGTFLEMDEGNRFAKGHPAIHVLPALWAQAETHRLSGKALMEALVLGYEIGARVGIAANLRPSMHPHGTWGTVGAAVALARLKGYDAAKTREAINIASSLDAGDQQAHHAGGRHGAERLCRRQQPDGLMAIDMVEAGFVGERDGLASVFGRVVSESFDTGKMIDGLGADWQIDRNYFSFIRAAVTITARSMRSKSCWRKPGSSLTR